tara:strand:+ start:1879 stop:2352 length:474 start_codon:yes stop_codon:yes gene_type:complete
MTSNKLSTGVIHRVWDSPKITLNLASYLTAWVRSILAGEPLMRIARRRSLVLLAVLCVVGTTPAEAVTDIDNLKLYAHSRIISEIEYNCFNKLITKESNWRINAINGSHYGLGQMRNPKYRNLDGYRMIDWSIKYIAHRYDGSSCKAFAHWKAKGWH